MPIRFDKHVAGLALLTWNLVDIFVTVLYARAGTGLIAPHLERLFWRLIRRISTVSRRGREHILSFGGPLLVVAVVAMWFVGLALQLLLAAGLLWWAWSRTNTPARRLPPGTRIA